MLRLKQGAYCFRTAALMGAHILDVAHILARPLIAFLVGVGPNILSLERYMHNMRQRGREPSTPKIRRLVLELMADPRICTVHRFVENKLRGEGNRKYMGRSIWSCRGMRDALKVWYDRKRYSWFYRLKGRRGVPGSSASRRYMQLCGTPDVRRICGLPEL